MAYYRSCLGCVREKQPCKARDAIRTKIAGLSVTSIKWRCGAREARINIGDPLWALTVDSTTESNGDGEPYRCYFPAVAVRARGAAMIVYIAPGVKDEELEIEFDPKSAGFCKIPLSRLKARDGEREAVCKSCERPASAGHSEGYACAFVRARETI